MLSFHAQLVMRGDLKKLKDAQERAVTGSMRTIGRRATSRVRSSLKRAGLGEKLPNAFRFVLRSQGGANITKRGQDAEPTGRLYSSAIYKRRKSETDLLEIHSRGSTIKGPMAIPTEKAGGRAAVPAGSLPQGTFRWVPATKRRARKYGAPVLGYLIHTRRDEVWYVVVASVTLKRRGDLYGITARVLPQLPEEHSKQFARQLVRAGLA